MGEEKLLCKKDVRKAVLRTAPGFHSNGALQGTYKVGGTQDVLLIMRTESHWKDARNLEEGCENWVSLRGIRMG